MLEEFRTQTTYKTSSVIGYMQVLLCLLLNLIYIAEQNLSQNVSSFIVFFGTPIIFLGYIAFILQLILISTNFYKFITTDNDEEDTKTSTVNFNYTDLGFLIGIIYFLTVLYLSMEKSGLSPLIIFVD